VSNRKHSYKYYENKACQFFPCHEDVWEEQGVHNCLFCYCPLYFKEDCGGDFTMVEEVKPLYVKDCSNCTKNHDKDSYEFIVVRYLFGGKAPWI